MDQLRSVMSGRIPPALFRTVKTTGRAIDRFSMVKPGEPILLGVSGGKDSSFLSLALAIRTKWLPEKNPLSAVFIEWKELPIAEREKEAIAAYFHTIGIPLEIIQASMYPPSFKGKFSCYLCSRNRKRILFDYAEQRQINVLALGHHMDDIIETTLINMVTRGYFSTMMPVQPFFEGKMRIIRPLCLVKEHAIERLCEAHEVPIVDIRCPNREENIRVHFKPIVRQFVHLHKHAREHIFNSCFNIVHDYLPEGSAPDTGHNHAHKSSSAHP